MSSLLCAHLFWLAKTRQALQCPARPYAGTGSAWREAVTLQVAGVATTNGSGFKMGTHGTHD